MYKISDEVINFKGKTMKTWRVEWTAGGKSFSETKIQRGIFQEDALSPLIFIIAMMPLNHSLRKCTAGYKLTKLLEKINHKIKVFAKNEKRIGKSYTRRQNMQSGHRNGIWQRNMRHASNKKQQMTPY